MEFNKIYQGDCREILKTFPDNSVDNVFTDPPGWLIWRLEKDISRVCTPEEYIGWITPAIREVYRIVKPGGFIGIIQCPMYLPYLFDWYGTDIHIGILAKNEYDYLCKTQTETMQSQFGCQYDPIVMYVKEGSRVERGPDFFLSDNKSVTERNTRPIGAIKEIVSRFTTGSILDPFCGGGTTLLAAKELGRDWIGIEVDSDTIKRAEEKLNAK